MTNKISTYPVSALALTCLAAACSSGQPASPSFVARTWSLQLDGVLGEAPAQMRGTPIRFGDAGTVYVGNSRDPRGDQNANSCCVERPLVVEGQTSFSLPPAPSTLEEIQERGLKVAAVTYCAFLNDSGAPQEQDIEAVNAAVESLLAALETPLREAAATERELARVAKLAGDALLSDVLRELEIPESEEAVLDAQGNLGLWFLGDLKRLRNTDLDTQFPSLSGMKELVDLLPSLVWVHAGPSARQTLSACGSILYLDAPYELLHNELRQLGHRCGNSEVSNPGTQFCLLELFERSFALQVQLDSPDLRNAPFAYWSIEPTVRFNRFGCAGGRKDHLPDGVCTTQDSLSVYANLEYSNDRGEITCGAEAVAAIAADCLIGARPRCGTETGLVLSADTVENREALSACVDRCTSQEVQRLSGSEGLSIDCRSCYANVTACAAACASPCSDGSYCPSCLEEQGCLPTFHECAGEIPISWPRLLF
jgi:hypothetical protein